MTKRYDNVIVLAANFNDFNALSKLDPDEFIATLETGPSSKDVRRIRTAEDQDEECCPLRQEAQ